MAGGKRDESIAQSDGAAVREVCILNRLGLHARASAQFVRIAEQFRAEVTVELGGQRVNAKSIMGLLMLAAGPGSTVTVEAHGGDASQALNELEELIKHKFGED